MCPIDDELAQWVGTTTVACGLNGSDLGQWFDDAVTALVGTNEPATIESDITVVSLDIKKFDANVVDELLFNELNGWPYCKGNRGGMGGGCSPHKLKHT